MPAAARWVRVFLCLPSAAFPAVLLVCRLCRFLSCVYTDNLAVYMCDFVGHMYQHVNGEITMKMLNSISKALTFFFGMSGFACFMSAIFLAFTDMAYDAFAFALTGNLALLCCGCAFLLSDSTDQIIWQRRQK